MQVTAVAVKVMRHRRTLRRTFVTKLSQAALLNDKPCFIAHCPHDGRDSSRRAAPKLCRFQPDCKLETSKHVHGSRVASLKIKGDEMGLPNVPRQTSPRNERATRSWRATNSDWRADQLLTIDTTLFLRALFEAAVARQSNINEKAFLAPAIVGRAGQTFFEDSRKSMRPENAIVV